MVATYCESDEKASMASEATSGDVCNFKKPATELRVPALPNGLLKPPATLFPESASDWSSHYTLSAEFKALKARNGSSSTPAPLCRRSLRHNSVFVEKPLTEYVQHNHTEDSGFDSYDDSAFTDDSVGGTYDYMQHTSSSLQADTPNQVESASLTNHCVVEDVSMFTDSAVHEASDLLWLQDSTLPSNDCLTAGHFEDRQNQNKHVEESADVIDRRLDVRSILNSSFEELRLDPGLDIPHSPVRKRRSLDKAILTKALHDTKEFKPMQPDRLIGRHIGLPWIDIPTRLSLMNASCLSKILGYLDDQDICNMCEVSREWCLIVKNDRCSVDRRSTYITLMRTDPIARKAVHHDLRLQWTGPRDPLTSIQQTSERPNKRGPVQTSTPMTKADREDIVFNMFNEVASMLRNDESLVKCPLCLCAAKVDKMQARAICSRKQCANDFCINCNRAFHGAKDCLFTPNITATVENAVLRNSTSTKKKSTGKLGSKSSKQRLRRL